MCVSPTDSNSYSSIKVQHLNVTSSVLFAIYTQVPFVIRYQNLKTVFLISSSYIYTLSYLKSIDVSLAMGGPIWLQLRVLYEIFYVGYFL